MYIIYLGELLSVIIPYKVYQNDLNEMILKAIEGDTKTDFY